MVQCPKCKKVVKNGKYINFHLKSFIPGSHPRLCKDCLIKIWQQVYSV